MQLALLAPVLAGLLISANTLPPKPREVDFEMPASIASVQVAETAGRLLFIGPDLSASCMQLSTGKRLWRTADFQVNDEEVLGFYPIVAAAGAHTVALMFTSNANGRAYREAACFVFIRKETGELIKVSRVLPGRGRDLIQVGKVFLGTVEGIGTELHAFDCDTGAELYKSNEKTYDKRVFRSVAGPPASVGQKLQSTFLTEDGLASLEFLPRGRPTSSWRTGDYLAVYYNIEDFMDEGDNRGLTGPQLFAASTHGRFSDLWHGKFLVRFDPFDRKTNYGPVLRRSPQGFVIQRFTYDGKPSTLLTVNLAGDAVRTDPLPFDGTCTRTPHGYVVCLANNRVAAFDPKGRLLWRQPKSDEEDCVPLTSGVLFESWNGGPEAKFKFLYYRQGVG